MLLVSGEALGADGDGALDAVEEAALVLGVHASVVVLPEFQKLRQVPTKPNICAIT